MCELLLNHAHNNVKYICACFKAWIIKFMQYHVVCWEFEQVTTDNISAQNAAQCVNCTSLCTSSPCLQCIKQSEQTTSAVRRTAVCKSALILECSDQPFSHERMNLETKLARRACTHEYQWKAQQKSACKKCSFGGQKGLGHPRATTFVDTWKCASCF